MNQTLNRGAVLNFPTQRLLCFLPTIMLLSCLAQAALAIQSNDDNQTQDAVQDFKPLEGEAREVAIQLVRQLSNPDFEVRQDASRKLWQIGKPAVELLQGIADGGVNSESRMRAKDVVTFIKVGLTPDADAEIVRCVVGFLDREILVQGRAIQKLCHLDQRDIAEKLIKLVPSESDRKALSKFRSVAASDAEIALRLGDDAKFNEWISAPSTRQSNRLVYHYNLWLEGKLDMEIDRLKEGEVKDEIEKLRLFDIEKKKQKAKDKKKNPAGKPAGKKKKNETPEQPELLTLVGLLRFTERWDEALKYADMVYDREERRHLTHSVLMESGNWKRLATLIVKPKKGKVNWAEKSDVHDGLAYPATGYRKALVHFYAGNEEEFGSAIKEIEAKIADEAKKKKRRGDSVPSGNSTHAQFLRYTLDFDRSLDYTSLKKNAATFKMLSDSRRFKKLFEVFKLETYEKRKRYFKSRMRHIRSLQKRVEYFTEQDDSDKRDAFVDKRDSAISFYRSVVSMLSTLGFDVEAEIFYRQLYFELSDELQYLGGQTVMDLQSMGAYESAWEIVEFELQRSKNTDFSRSLFLIGGQNNEVAAFLEGQLRKKIKDPIARYRKIAQLIKSPLDLSNEEIDFWEEIAEFDFSANSSAIKHLFSIWGLEEEGLFKRATSSVGAQSGEQQVKEGNFLLAGQMFEATALSEDYPVHFARAWDAYKKGGSAKKAKQMRLLFAMKFDTDDAWDYTSGYSGTDWQSLPFDIYRLHDAIENTQVGESCYYMWLISKGDAKSVLSSHQKMVRTQILRLRYIDSPYFDSSENDHPQFIAGSLDAGDAEGAKRWFRKLSSYSPADSSFVEKNFPAFKKANHDEFVNEIFEKVSNDFFEILESFPDSSMYRNNYAWACACAKRNAANGIEIAKRAVELRPGTAGHYDTLAELYHVNGDNDLAIETIGRAIEINPMRDYYREQLKKFREAKKSVK